MLLAEDESIVRRLMIQALSRDGWRVLEASWGAAALRVAAECGTPIDLLVTDIVMPGMGGRELAERLQNLQPGLPVLFVTGFSSEADSPDRPSLADAALLHKPFVPEAFVARVREFLGASGR